MINFKYYPHFSPQPFIFLIDMITKTCLPQRLLVKFTQHYDPETHRVCAEVHIAPMIYGYEKLPGSWYMVVMEYLVDFQNLFDIAPGDLIKYQVKMVINQIHHLGVAHTW